MTDKTDLDDDSPVHPMPEPGPDNPEGMSSIDRLPLMIHSQYIKDLSFENPNAPLPLQKAAGKPRVDVDLAMDAKKLEMEGYEDAYEVVLHVNLKVVRGTVVTFVAELEYGMMVTLDQVPEEKIHPLLLIEMPTYMFPYVREIIANITQKAGFYPFMMAPVNFKALYRKRFGGPRPAVTTRDAPAEDAEKSKAEKGKAKETA